MKVNLSVKSDQLNKEDLRALLQAIRDCEMATFPDKEIYVAAEAPELSTDEMTEILTSIKPPYNYGPVIFKYAEKEGVTSDALEALKAQHQAIDRLFAELIKRDPDFFPSKSGQPWEACKKGNAVIKRMEG
ncbi:hypothetical protein ES703_78336 [subsurface metagenome]